MNGKISELKSGEKHCPKCNGTGFFSLGTVDGSPYSNTGFDCWKCNGTGKIADKTRRQRCPRCNVLIQADQIDCHEYNSYSNGELTLVICKA